MTAIGIRASIALVFLQGWVASQASSRGSDNGKRFNAIWIPIVIIMLGAAGMTMWCNWRGYRGWSFQLTWRGFQAACFR